MLNLFKRQVIFLKFIVLILLLKLLNTHSLSIRVAPQAEECLTFALGSNDELSGSFSVLPEVARHVVVRVYNTANGAEIFKSTREREGKWYYKVTDPATPGDCDMCIKNEEHYDILMDFSVRTTETLYSSAATGDKTANLLDIVRSLHTKVFELDDQQRYTLRREEAHRKTAESTNKRVIWWIMVKVATIIILVCIQNYYLRSFFEIKTTV